ncbi:MAG: hypothetical protein AABZ55_00700, partial [Bdellovibrionota bacterium]
SLFRVLGYEIEVKYKSRVWDLLSVCGAPLLLKAAPRGAPTKSLLFQSLHDACLEIGHLGQTEDRDRKTGAIQALLLALCIHFPSVFKQVTQDPEIKRYVPMTSDIQGRLIKLSRMSVAILSTYL